ncbi:MAG: hypothetical protein M1823_006262 [Watsoniomyces obsoletus]|nr:MAG: hypothetical protein M1823_006262 [Watsoniomyces obsoletus]
MSNSSMFAPQAAPPAPTPQQAPQAPVNNSNATHSTSTSRADGMLQVLAEAQRRDAANANATSANKRKRQGSELQDAIAIGGDGATPGRRGGPKRVAGNNANNTNAGVLSSNDLGDAAASALMAATTQAGNQEDIRRASATSLDFAALSQAPSQRTQMAMDSQQQQQLDQLASRATASTLADPSSTAAAALGIYPITIPQPTALTFANNTTGTGTGGDHERNLDPAFSMSDQEAHGQQGGGFDGEGSPSGMVGGSTPGQGGRESGNQKPQVGSEQWHRNRRDNHKEVERRRRETINEGINELAKIVPGCEKNKGSILQRSVAFIIQLKQNEEQNIEKWTLEKLLGEQAIAELSAGMDRYQKEAERLTQENERAWREVEMWKKKCEAAGVASISEDASKAAAES